MNKATSGLLFETLTLATTLHSTVGEASQFRGQGPFDFSAWVSQVHEISRINKIYNIEKHL
jgi:hypothetical protein